LPSVNPQLREDFVLSVILFVYQHLDKWRDNPLVITETDEVRLTADICKFLTTISREETELNIRFDHEEPQEGLRKIDIGVGYNNSNCYNTCITVFECKLLPPSKKNEYIITHKDTLGGIQRFKLKAHGKDHNIVGMIGYVQKKNCMEWQKEINTCIDSLCEIRDENGLSWSTREHLSEIEFDITNRKYHGVSNHPRRGISEITIHHLWVEMG
jgi:hypothetical protein